MIKYIMSRVIVIWMIMGLGVFSLSTYGERAIYDGAAILAMAILVGVAVWACLTVMSTHDSKHEKAKRNE